MIETEEQILTALEIAGENIEFADFTIKAIPNELLKNVSSFDSPYDVLQQGYYFLTAEKYIDFFGIEEGSEFSYTIFNVLMRFKVITNPVSDLTGWVRLDVKCLGTEYV